MNDKTTNQLNFRRYQAKGTVEQVEWAREREIREIIEISSRYKQPGNKKLLNLCIDLK